MMVQAEVSLYPLGEKDLLPPILAFVRCLERAGLRVEPGPLATLVAGESAAVFEALREAYDEACLTGRRALVVKMINGGIESWSVEA